jgi:hypothetical protein
VKKEPITLEEVALNQYTLDISDPCLGKKHERFITIPQLRKLGFTLTSKEYTQAYKNVANSKENLREIRVLAFVKLFKQKQCICS